MGLRLAGNGQIYAQIGFFDLLLAVGTMLDLSIEIHNMKKAFVILMLVGLFPSVVALTINYSTAEVTNHLIDKNWQFKTVSSQDPTTLHYLTTLYGEAGYRFADNHTYTGKFFELPVTGTWEISDEMLILNKGSLKEETYKFAFPSEHTLILQTSEKNNKVIIELEQH